MSGAIEGEVVVSQDRRRGRCPSREGHDPGDELGESERLTEVVVRAELQPVDPMLDFCGGGEHEDAGAGAGESPTHLVAMHDGQISVEHDHVIGRRGRGFEGGRAVEHKVYRHPRLAQSLSDTARKRRMVLDHQHPHRPSMRPLG